jgi:FKBP-type peptidyl-prolyl cis-trans isomerase FklB
MQKLLVSLALLTASTTVVYAQTGTPVKHTTTPAAHSTQPQVLKNGEDSLSYAIGVNVATYFKSQGIKAINTAELSRAIEAIYAGKAPMLNDQQAVTCIQDVIQKRMRDSMLAKSKPNKDEGAKFMAENKKRPGVFTLNDGLQYEVIRRGTGPTPADTSVVKVNYTGYLLNGKKFDASADHGGPATFPLNRVIKGWTEGLQQMPVGSTFKFYIPSDLAYGDRGSGEVIPPGSTLIFEVDLLDIVHPDAPAAAPASGQSGQAGQSSQAGQSGTAPKQ